MMADIEIYTERMLVVSGDRGLFISVLGIKVFLVPLHLHLRGSVQIQKTLQPFIMNHNILCHPARPPPALITSPNKAGRARGRWRMFCLLEAERERERGDWWDEL